MSTLRVVQVTLHRDPHGRDGRELLGARPTLTQVAHAIARTGIDLTVLQLAGRDATIEQNGVAYVFVRDEGSIARQISALAPDVIHLHGLNAPRAAHRTVAQATAPVLVQDHGSRPPHGWRRHGWRWVYRKLAGVAFTAREQAIDFVSAGALSSAVPVHEVLESSSTFTPADREEAQARTGMFGDPCLLWVGRLDANKDPLTALAAFEIAAAHLPHARLWCCWGQAPLLDVVQRRVTQSAVLRERVALLGVRPRSEMEDRMRAADFLVQTSQHEGSGYAVLEALACGTTPLVTSIPAFRRMVDGAGSLTPCGDVDALAAAIVAYANGDRDAHRRIARARFDAALTFDAVGQEVRAAYDAIAR